MKTITIIIILGITGAVLLWILLSAKKTLQENNGFRGTGKESRLENLKI